MMPPRIETAEILSHRLMVPLTALGDLPDQVQALPLVVHTDGERFVRVSLGECRLAFVPEGQQARLTEVVLKDDERGLFFHKVLGPLVVRHGGDLHLRLTWNIPERNTHGAFAEVTILQGATTYPGLSPASDAPARPSVTPESDEQLQAARAEEDEVERLLEEGRRHFQEYLRLTGRPVPSSVKAGEG
jgi:hypothetical protein